MSTTNNSFLSNFLNENDQEKIIIETKKKSYSHRQLTVRIQNISNYLSITPKNAKIGLLCLDFFEYIAAFLAILQSGRNIVIIDPYFSEQITSKQLQSLDVDYIYTDWRMTYFTKMPGFFFVINYFNNISLHFLDKFKLISCKNNIVNTQKNIQFNYDSHNNYIYIPTGGTTGSPKIVQHTQENINESIARLSQLMISGDTMYCDLPYMGILGLLLGKKAFYGGGHNNLLKTIEKGNINILFTQPDKLIGSGKLPDCLSSLILGGAPVYDNFIQKLYNANSSTDIYCLYGMTECLPVSWFKADKQYFSSFEHNNGGNDLGTPFGDITYHIHNHELIINTNHVVYAGTSQTDIYSGDLVFEKNGRLYLMGRKKNMIIKKGINIYPGLYENLYLAIPGVLEAVMFGVYDTIIQDEKVIIAIAHDPQYSIKKIKQDVLSIKIHTEISLDDIFFTKIPKSGRQQKTNVQKIKELYILSMQGK